TRCPGGPSAAVLAPVRSRGVQACKNREALPGSGLTPAALETCIEALKADATPCGNLPSECLVNGTLPDGSQCADDVQCSGGRCLLGFRADTKAPLDCGLC